MENFAQTILSARIPREKVGVFFLGQAGFAFKTASGELIALDPYLSDCCERYFGFKRLMPHLLDAREVIFDTLILTHAHYDHFDPDSVPVLMASGRTHMIGAKDTAAECERLNIKDNVTFLGVGQTVTAGEVMVKGMPCDHGELAPDALGILLTVGGKRIYIMGDTAYRPDLLENPEIQGVDLLILPINGAFGNLNEEQAAKVIAALKPALAIPCHFWNFAEHGGDPGKFQAAMAELAPDCAYRLMRQGEGMLL
jgi:L-ascorbate 6-phosphate lactonase